MFTGIVVEQGRVVEPAPQLVLDAPGVAADAALGDSVAIDGCCLTITAIDGARLSFDAVPETLRRTTLGSLRPGDLVNLEPALRAGDRMGGHLVQGHVDDVGTLVSETPEGDQVLMEFEAADSVLRYAVMKGSIAVNGVSLTIASLEPGRFGVAVIPHTREVTGLGALEVGARVNLEADLFGKYVERIAGLDRVVQSD
jgi:riboflavin synthase